MQNKEHQQPQQPLKIDLPFEETLSAMLQVPPEPGAKKPPIKKPAAKRKPAKKAKK